MKKNLPNEFLCAWRAGFYKHSLSLFSVRPTRITIELHARKLVNIHKARQCIRIFFMRTRAESARAAKFLKHTGSLCCSDGSDNEKRYIVEKIIKESKFTILSLYTYTRHSNSYRIQQLGIFFAPTKRFPRLLLYTAAKRSISVLVCEQYSRKKKTRQP